MLYAREAKEQSAIFKENIMKDELQKAKNSIEKAINRAVAIGDTSASIPLRFTFVESIEQIEQWITSFGYDIDWFHIDCCDHRLKIYWYNA